MSLNTLYFVPWSSIAESSGPFGSINTNLDTGNLLAAIFQTNTISLVGPTTTIDVNDTSSTPDVFTDDFEFTDQTLASDYDGNPAGSGVETLYSYTLSGSDGSIITVYGVAIGGTATEDTLDGFVTTQPLLPSVTYTIVGVDSTVDVDYDTLVPCFVAGSMIETANGAKPVEALAVNDLIVTVDHGLQPIRWCGSKSISFDGPKARQKLRPIRIQANAIAPGLPNQDLFVSPQHRMLVRSKICQRMFSCDEVLVAAKHLCCMDGIDVATDIETVQYTHILFENHEIVHANGAATESLLKGPEALKAVGIKAFREIATLFPEICKPDYHPIGARKIIPGRLGKKLAERHYKNKKALFEMSRPLAA